MVIGSEGRPAMHERAAGDEWKIDYPDTLLREEAQFAVAARTSGLRKASGGSPRPPATRDNRPDYQRFVSPPWAPGLWQAHPRLLAGEWARSAHRRLQLPRSCRPVRPALAPIAAGNDGRKAQGRRPAAALPMQPSIP
jgi:hypothetical protein